MTLQDDLDRHWFQPMIPASADSDRAQPTRRPRVTRFAGELNVDDTEIALPRRSSDPLVPARVEVTQPYIPAIRDTPPDFAQRLAPSPPATDPPAQRPAATPTPPEPQQPTQAETTETPPSPSSAPSSNGTAVRPAKRRSLVRRVVRRIIGPDLLRKDPPRR